MSDTTYIDYVQPAVSAEWLNEINDHVWHDTPVMGVTVHDASVIKNTPAGTISSTNIQDAINELDADKLSSLFTQTGTGAIPRSYSSKVGESFSVKDFGAIGDGVTDDSVAFSAAIAAALKGTVGGTVLVPVSSMPYLIKDVSIPSAVKVVSGGLSSARISPVADGDTCFVLNGDFATLDGLSFTGTGKTATSTAIKITHALGFVKNCSFAFWNTCVSMPKNYSSAECHFYGNRFAQSSYGIKMDGGQINTTVEQSTFSDCLSAIQIREDTAQGVSSTTEGVNISNCLIYSSGDASIGAIDISGCRWITLNNTMIDLSKSYAIRALNSPNLSINGGYLSSNQSTNKSALSVSGSCSSFCATNVTFADSRNWGAELFLEGGTWPANARFIGCTFMNNGSYSGDLLVNSVWQVQAIACQFLSVKANDIAVLNNLSSPSSLELINCHVPSGVTVAKGSPNCMFVQKGVQNFPDKQVGYASFGIGVSSVNVPLTIIPMAGQSVAVIVTGASVIGTVYTAGVFGGNIVISRNSTGAAEVANFIAELVQ